MIPLLWALHAIMRDYFTFIRDYFTDYFTDHFTDYLTIIRDYFTDYTNYFTVLAPRKWECADSNSSPNHE
jgi:hypothetical protein